MAQNTDGQVAPAVPLDDSTKPGNTIKTFLYKDKADERNRNVIAKIHQNINM